MLLITRREGEAIMVNGTIEVRVLEIRGGRVKLGFEYPAGNTVFRQELFAKIQAENEAAAALPGNQAGLQAALGKLGQPKVGTEPASNLGKKKAQPHDPNPGHPRRRSTDN